MHNLRGRQFRDAGKESISECATLVSVGECAKL